MDLRPDYKGFWNPRQEVGTKYNGDLEGVWPISHVVGSWYGEMRFFCFFRMFAMAGCIRAIWMIEKLEIGRKYGKPKEMWACLLSWHW